MRISEAAQASGLTPDTIRFYERTGVLPRPPRRPNGYRQHTQQHVVTLQLVSGLRHLRLSLREIQQVADVAYGASCDELGVALIDRLEHVAAETERRVRELEHTREHVDRLLRGLREITPGDTPGSRAAACSCVALVDTEARD